jgi:hypothetical protein
MKINAKASAETKPKPEPINSAATAASLKLTESMIAESMLIRIGLDQPMFGARPEPPEAPLVRESLIAICSAPTETEIEFYGRKHCFIWPTEMKRSQGTQILSRSDDPTDLSIKIQMTLAPKDQPAQHIRVTYRLFKNNCCEEDDPEYRKEGDPRYFLECEGNPTTVLAGNNVFPVTTVDQETGEAEKLPSSSRASMKVVNRALCDLLKAVSEAVLPDRQCLLDFWTLNRIEEGNFELVRAQYCCYLSTPNVLRFLQLICLLYAQTVHDAERVSTLANHLGLAVKQFIGKNNRVTGVQFQKRHGTKPVVSLVFYDKQRRIAQMRQGKTLAPEEKELVNRAVRYDMTLHRRGIEQMVGEARKVLEEHRQKRPNFLANAVSANFLRETPETTMEMFEDAVTILSHKVVRNMPKRYSFSSGLVKRTLNGILGLGNIVKWTPARLHAFTELPNPVVKAWYAPELTKGKGRWPKKGDWTTPIMERTGLGKTHVYEERKQLLAEHGIDISIAHKFYRDLEHLGPKSLINAENREALNRALSKNADKDEVFRLLHEGIDNFFAQLVEVVGATVNGPPTKLPLKKVGDTSSRSLQAKHVAAREANTGIPQRRRSKKQTINALRREGFGPHSAEARLLDAMNSTRIGLAAGNVSDRERDDMKLRLQVLSRWLRERANLTKQQQATRRRNRMSPPRK